MMTAVVGISAERTVDDYASEISEFFRVEEHPVLRRPYSETVYQPMVELLQYLEQHEFTTFIVSAGDRDFMRPMTAGVYGIPPERVIGSAIGLVYTEDESGGDVRYAASFSFLADGPEKPIRIWSRIGRRPDPRRRQLQRRSPDAPLRPAAPPQPQPPHPP